MVGRSIGRVRWRNRCHALAPSTIPASSISSPMLFSAAMNSSMNVPEVVKTAISTKADIATDGPASQSHQLTPRKSCSVRPLGPVVHAERGERDVEDAARIDEPVRSVEPDPARGPC